LGLLVVIIILTILVNFRSGLWGPLIIAIDCMPFLMVVVVGSLMKRQMTDIWHSQRRIVRARAMDLLDPLNEALKDGGFEPVARSSGVTLLFAEGGTTFDLKDGLNLTLVDAGTRTVLYLGPDRDETRRDVEGVKTIVDRVLEGMESQPPSRP
jgi:hypothetical protein